MQKIALIGAPTSGKTELAQALKESLSNVYVVDDYIQEIESRSDNTLGHFGSYFGNLQVVVGRWEFERRAVRDHKPDHLITCGTMVESTVYNAVQALIQHDMDSGGVSLGALQNDRRASVSMTLLGIIRYDTFDYDHVFYLPMSDEEKELDDNKWNAIVDAHIPECAEALGVTYTKLSDRESRLAEVLQEVLVDEATVVE